MFSLSDMLEPSSRIREAVMIDFILNYGGLLWSWHELAEHAPGVAFLVLYFTIFPLMEVL